MPRAGSSRNSQPTAGGSSSSTPSGGNTRRRRKEEQSMMDEYHDMLVDSYQTDPALFAKDTPTESRPRKRPGAGASVRKPSVAATDSENPTSAAIAATTPTKSLSTRNSRSKDRSQEAKMEVTTPTGKSIAVEIPSSMSAESARKRRRVEVYDGHTGDETQVLPGSSKSKAPTGDEEMLDMDAESNAGNESDNDESVQDSGSEYDSEEEDDEDSDVDWENIDLGQSVITAISAPIKKQPSNLSVNVTALIAERDKSNRRRRGPGNRRKPPTPMERKIRLEVHKLHVLCMLAHTNLRSEYCNDTVAQKRLRKILDKKVVSELIDNPTSHEYSTRLKTGLSNAMFHFRRKFKVILPGLRKPLWRDDEEDEDGRGKAAVEIPAYGDEAISLEEFRAAAMNMEGTRDLGAQLFCAMLRAIGMTVRLVTNLQVLSYTFTKAGRKGVAEKTKGALKPSETMTPSRRMGSSSSGSGNAGTFKGDVNPKFGGPGPMVAGEAVPRSKKENAGSPSKVIPKKPVILPKMNDPDFPVYWVEVFDIRAQEWITVDPLVTRTVKKPLQLEPPMSDANEIEMAYVVAFEAEGQAKDVTRRYVKAYNGRTRLIRVEATKDGDKWWRKALKPFRRGYPLDRDQIEEAALSQRELAEGLPSSIAAFKSHPVFALEELCRRNEVIHPKRQVATMPGGRMKKGGKPVPVYRRSDVKTVKTTRQWYMLGRVINIGEQPLKMQIKKPGQRRKSKDGYGNINEQEEEEEDEEVNQGMYAEHQTSLYEPPAVMFGLIPKNDFGNVDVFVPSMVPKGAVHLTRSSNKLLSKAAKELDIDYADAIVGFDHKGRAATAIIKGIIVAEENVKKIQDKLAEMEAEIAEEEKLKKQIEMLKLWKKFLIGLRIIERLDEYGPVDDEKDGEALSSMDKGKMKAIFDKIEEEQQPDEEPEVDEAGGFFRGGEEDEQQEDNYASRGGGFFLPEETEEDNASNSHSNAGGVFADGEASHGDTDVAMSGSGISGGGGGGGFIPEGEDDNSGGGFMPEDDNGGAGGGFIRDNEEELQNQKTTTAAADDDNPFMFENDASGKSSPTYSERGKMKTRKYASPAARENEEGAELLVPQHEDDEEIGEDDFEYDEDDGLDFD